jgi:hypothetical protein
VHAAKARMFRKLQDLTGVEPHMENTNLPL